MEMLHMTKENGEAHFERQTTWAIVAIDFGTATVTQIPTDKGQATVKGMEVYRHKKGLVLETNVDTDNDDGSDQGNDGTPDGARP